MGREYVSKISVFLLFLITMFSASSVFATDVGGTISVDATWTVSESPYIVTQNVAVAPGVTIKIK